MTEGIVQLPADSTGKKIRTRERTIGANTVQEEGVFIAAGESWVAYANAVAFAANKSHIAIFNAVGSGKVIKCKKLFVINITAAVTGIIVRFDINRATAASAGTTITPVSFDTINAALPAGITVRTGGTITDGSLLFPFMGLSEEETATQALTKASFHQFMNILMEGNEIQELTLREGEGMTVKQITSSTVGSVGWILVFTVE